MSGTILKAKVLAVDPIHVHICCPICGTIHRHGSNGNIKEQNYGTRVAHCGTTDLPWTNGGSFWDNPRGDSYELVCTPETVRQDEDASAYVKRWYKENRLTAYNKERQQRARDTKQIAKAEGISLYEAYRKLMMAKKPEIQIL
jgi:hypothetical protein